MQVVSDYGSLEAALECLPGVAGQTDCIGVRVTGGECERRDPDSARLVTTGWGRVISYVNDLPDGASYPDGCRSVLVPDTMMRDARAARDAVRRAAALESVQARLLAALLGLDGA